MKRKASAGRSAGVRNEVPQEDFGCDKVGQAEKRADTRTVVVETIVKRKHLS